MRNKLKNAAALCPVVFLYVLFHISGIGCPIKFLTGVSCAGCGMTRAWQSALALDLSSAFEYHPMFLLPLIYAVLYLFRKRMDTDKIQFIFLIALFALYLVRIIDKSDNVVVFAPENGLIFMALRKAGGFLKWL